MAHPPSDDQGLSIDAIDFNEALWWNLVNIDSNRIESTHERCQPLGVKFKKGGVKMSMDEAKMKQVRTMYFKLSPNL